MGRNNKELHEALENLDGTEFTIGSTIAKTLKNFNSAHTISVTTFTLGTVDSTVVVKNSAGATVTAESNGTYKLHEETYSVTNSKANYISKTTNVTISQTDITAGVKAVTLSALTPAIEIESMVATVDGAEVPIVDNAITVAKDSVTTKIEVVVSEEVTVVADAKAKVKIADVWYDYGAITVDETDATLLTITPSGTNGVAGLAGVFQIKLEANKVLVSESVGNLETIITLTVTE